MSSKTPRAFTGATIGMRVARPIALHADHIDAWTRRFVEAMLLMKDGCWQAAFTSLAELADGGHPQAARIALLFVRRGTSLFGGTFHASPEQRDGWQRALDY